MSEFFQGRTGVLTKAAVAVALALVGGGLLLGPAGPVRASSPALQLADPAPALSPVAARESYADLVQRVAPSVVTIRTLQVVKADMQSDLFHRFFGVDPRSPEPPAQQRGGLGSGVVVSADGYILTNHHVVDGAQSITVELSDRRQVDATLVGSDPPSDLAVLRIEATGLTPLPLGRSDAVRVGDVVLAFGNPLGVGQTVTAGIISAKGRATGIGDGSYEDFLQTDAPINQGNSGGALVSTRGELVGINTQIVSQSGGNIGIGFAIPSDMAKDVMSQLVDHGRVRRGRLGVAVQAVTADLAKSLGLDEVRGALVSQVDADGPAAAAGIQRGDVITGLDDETVRDSNDLRNRVARRDPGSAATIHLLRDGHERTVKATLAEMNLGDSGEAASADGSGNGRYGMSVQPVTPDLARRLDLDAANGLVVSDVDPTGAAARAGIRRGDVIEEVDRKPVSDVESLKAALEGAGDRPALLLVRRDGSTLFLTLSHH